MAIARDDLRGGPARPEPHRLGDCDSNADRSARAKVPTAHEMAQVETNRAPRNRRALAARELGGKDELEPNGWARLDARARADGGCGFARARALEARESRPVRDPANEISAQR